MRDDPNQIVLSGGYSCIELPINALVKESVLFFSHVLLEVSKGSLLVFEFLFGILLQILLKSFIVALLSFSFL